MDSSFLASSRRHRTTRVSAETRIVRGAALADGLGRAMHLSAKMPRRPAVLPSSLQQRIALLDQLFKLFSLCRDPVRVSVFILGT